MINSLTIIRHIQAKLMALLILLFAVHLPVVANTESGHNVSNVKIGVLAYRSEESTRKRWMPLIDYLNQQNPEYDFTLVAGNYDQLQQKILRQDIHFLLTQPSHYVALAHQHNLSSPLVSMLNKEGKTGCTLFGGVMFTRADQSDVSRLSDIKQKTIATPSKKSLGSYQMQMFEILDEGIVDKPSDLNIIETGLPQINAIKAVLNHEADIGFVRSGVLEKLYKDGTFSPDQIKILNAKSFDEFPLMTSTRLYPEWPFASLSHTPTDISKDVMQALLAIKSNSELAKHLKISGFTIAEDYRVIDQLLKKLSLPPFNQKQAISLTDIWEQWQHVIHVAAYLILLLVLLLSLYLFKKNKALNKLKNQLMSSNQQLQKLTIAVDQSPIRILTTNTKGQIEYANRTTVEQSGFPLNELYQSTPKIFSSGEMPATLFKELWHTVKQGKIWYGEIINRSKSGERQILKTTITPIKNEMDKITGFLSIQRDITQEIKSQNKIHQLAFYDSLTGLANRTLLEERLQSEITDSLYEDMIELDEHEQPYLILINLDKFKVVNDANGKEIGDELLKQFAKKLQVLIAPHDLVAHLTADEFAILFHAPNTLNNRITDKSNQILKTLRTPFAIQNQEIQISASIGVAPIFSNDTHSVSEIIKHADTALHFAKAKGGNQIQVFDKTLEEQAIEYFQIEQDLKTALSKKQLEVHYQPQVNKEGHLVGAEALIRWNHPEQGMVSPAKFIPIAEQTDLIIDIGYWVLEEACQKLAQAFEQGNQYNLSVNISPRQFLKENFTDKLFAIIQETGIEPEYLTLEITEGLFFHDLEEILPIMHQLTQKGMKFSIDDFGTGYSSLAYLKSLPVSELKIDRIFIQDVVTDKNDAVLVESILSIAEHMKFDVVAEGVEKQVQADFFRNTKKIIFQGFFFGKPVSYDEFSSTWLSNPDRH